MARTTSSSSKPRTSSGAQETFNQILLMLILAFSFRTFIVEAFVIPTGSMAPTLMGAHARFTCDNCGYDFDVNYGARGSSPTDISVPSNATIEGHTHEIFCANCGYPVPEGKRVNSEIHYGDRILVLKYAYLLQQPRRWDVVVFKTPTQPEVYHYNQAYIKRLVGKPGEQVMILDGDLYIAPEGQAGNWQIQRKPQHVQDALWRVVHDTDFAPVGLTPEDSSRQFGAEDYLPWKTSEENGWHYSRDGQTGARAFLFADLAGKGELHFERSVAPHKDPLTDWLAYDQSPGQQYGTWPVSDLKLSFFYSRAAGGGSSGPLQLRLSKRDDLFIAELLPNQVSLYKAKLANPESRQLLAQAPCSLGETPTRIDFMNVDYQVRLLLDGKQLLATTPEQYSPHTAKLLQENLQPPYPQVSLVAQQQVCTITHLSLWRDVFYTERTANGDPAHRGTKHTPVQLATDEYFVLGDNSPLSGDGRYWDDKVSLPAENVHAQAGVVPSRFLLGKAFLVYWPSGFRLLQTQNRSLDAIPNFGEMRFIH